MHTQSARSYVLINITEILKACGKNPQTRGTGPVWLSGLLYLPFQRFPRYSFTDQPKLKGWIAGQAGHLLSGSGLEPRPVDSLLGVLITTKNL